MKSAFAFARWEYIFFPHLRDTQSLYSSRFLQRLMSFLFRGQQWKNAGKWCIAACCKMSRNGPAMTSLTETNPPRATLLHNGRQTRHNEAHYCGIRTWMRYSAAIYTLQQCCALSSGLSGFLLLIKIYNCNYNFTLDTLDCITRSWQNVPDKKFIFQYIQLNFITKSLQVNLPRLFFRNFKRFL